MKRLVPFGFCLLVLMLHLLGPLPLEERSSAQGLRANDWAVFDYRNDVDASDGTFGGVGAVQAGITYSLQNKSIPNVVKYGSREYGVNLIWGPTNIRQEGDVRFEPQVGTGSIKQGQTIAIFVAKGGYLFYKKRTYGINLEYARTPQYEWELRPNPLEPRDAVGLKQTIGLYNTVVRDYVVYCRREYGINLGWARDCEKGVFRPQ